MTPPAAFDGAKFLRLADKFRHLADSLCGIIDADPVESALRYAATLADELARVRASIALCDDFARQYSAMFAKLNAEDIAALNATIMLAKEAGRLEALNAKGLSRA